MNTESETNERELFVASDIQSIPIFELRPMCKNWLEWLIAIVVFKICRVSPPIEFATETRRMVRIEARDRSQAGHELL